MCLGSLNLEPVPSGLSWAPQVRNWVDILGRRCKGQSLLGSLSSEDGCLEQLSLSIALNGFPAEGEVPCLHILKSEKSYLACTTGVQGAFMKPMGGKDMHIFASKRKKEHLSSMRKLKY